MLEAVVGAIHSVALVLIAGALCSEYFLFRRGMSETDVEKVLIADLLQQLAIMLLIVSGVIRLHWFEQPEAFYLNNALFWLKLSMILAIILLSIYPSITFWRWRAAIKQNRVSLITRHQQQLIIWAIRFELSLLLIIPFLSAFVRYSHL